MMTKGYLPYRDFVMQHGLISYLLLAPFSFYKSLIMMKFFYIFVQSINLILVLLIARKITNNLGIIIAGIIYIALNFYISDNNLWDEIYATTFFLLTLYLTTAKKIGLTIKLLLMGLLIGFTTLMKPSFGIMIIPVILFYRNFLPLISIILLWALTLLYFFVNNGLYDFFNNYIFYNKYFITLPKNFWIERGFLNITIFIFLLSLFFYLFLRNVKKTAYLDLVVLFSLASLTLFYPGYNKIYLHPFSTFLTIMIAGLIGKINRPFLFIYLAAVLLFGIFILRKAKNQFAFINENRIPYIENKKIEQTVNGLKDLPLDNKKLFVWGNQIEIYYLLDKPSQIRFPMVVPDSIAYYKSVEDSIIQDLQKNKIEIIVAAKPLNPYYLSLSKIKKHILTNYRLIKDNQYFQLYSK